GTVVGFIPWLITGWQVSDSPRQIAIGAALIIAGLIPAAHALWSSPRRAARPAASTDPALGRQRIQSIRPQPDVRGLADRYLGSSVAVRQPEPGAVRHLSVDHYRVIRSLV